MIKIIFSVKNAIRGLKSAFKEDKSFRMEVFGGSAFIIIGWIFWPLSGVEFALLCLAYILILIIELVNTAFEQMLERIHPERNEIIGKSKDISASAVLLAFIFAIIVVVLIFLERISIISF